MEYTWKQKMPANAGGQLPAFNQHNSIKNCINFKSSTKV